MNQQSSSNQQPGDQLSPSWEPHHSLYYEHPSHPYHQKQNDVAPKPGQTFGCPSPQGWSHHRSPSSHVQVLPLDTAATQKKHGTMGYSLTCGMLILLCVLFACVGVLVGNGARASASTSQALVFAGVGTSPTDTTLLVQILASHGFTYHLVDSPQLAAMGIDELATYRLILWPGGDSITMTRNLSVGTRENVREAVVTRGVNYVGFCAGAFMAVGLTAPKSGGWGLGIVPGNYLGLYFPPGVSHPSPSRAVMTDLRFANGSHNEIYWQYGPVLPPWSHGRISTYPTGQAAMGEIWSGKGFVVLSGVHPEATQGWLTAKHLVDPDGLDSAVAWSLIQAAYTQKPLAAV